MTIWPNVMTDPIESWTVDYWLTDEPSWTGQLAHWYWPRQRTDGQWWWPRRTEPSSPMTAKWPIDPDPMTEDSQWRPSPAIVNLGVVTDRTQPRPIVGIVIVNWWPGHWMTQLLDDGGQWQPNDGPIDSYCVIVDEEDSPIGQTGQWPNPAVIDPVLLIVIDIVVSGHW